MRYIALAACCVLAACSAEQQNDVVVETRSDQVQPTSPAVPVAQAPAAASGGGCMAGEETIFSCKTAADKRIAVCAARGGPVEYRYGAGEPELTVAGGRFASVPYSGGGEAQLAFDNAGTRYVVFSRIVRTNFAPGEPNNPAISDGVMVLQGEKVVSVQVCSDTDPVPVQYDVAARHMEQENELFTEETSRVDP